MAKAKHGGKRQGAGRPAGSKNKIGLTVSKKKNTTGKKTGIRISRG